MNDKQEAADVVARSRLNSLLDEIKAKHAELNGIRTELNHLTTEVMQQVAILSSAKEDLAHVQAEYARIKRLVESINKL